MSKVVLKLLAFPTHTETLKKDQQEQVCKIAEEFHEVTKAYSDYKRSQEKEHLESELMDLMQACKSMLDVLDSDIFQANRKHIDKLRERAKVVLDEL